MLIPPERLDPDTLNALLEDFVTRDGTDNGYVDVEMADKVSVVKAQLQNGKVVIVFDPETQTVQLITAEDYHQTNQHI